MPRTVQARSHLFAWVPPPHQSSLEATVSIPQESRRLINRVNNETPLLLRYRDTVGGTLVLEYPPIATRIPGAATRKVDAVLLRDLPSLSTRLGKTSIYDWELATDGERLEIDRLVSTSDTAVLQAKNSALGPYLLGQAHFSPRLIGSTCGVAIAGGGTHELLRIAASLSVDVVHDPLARSRTEARRLIKPDAAFVERYHTHAGGALLTLNGRGGRGMPPTGIVADAIILPDTARTATNTSLTSVRGNRTVAVCSTTQRLGMYVMGAAVCALHKLRDLGAIEPEVVILCKQSDNALAPLLREHPRIRVITQSEAAAQGW